jgi:hypothetical protein
MELLSVPFTHRSMTSTGEGMITVHGVARTEPAGLVVEWRSRESYFGAKPSSEGEIRAVTIPWKEVQSIDYRRRFLFRGVLVVRTRGLRALDGVPGAVGPELTLPIARDDQPAARDLAASLALDLMTRRWDEVDEPGTPPALPSA